MSITNYTELQTAIGNWLARSDLSSYIPDFVTLAEQRIFYGSDDPAFPSPPLRIRAMETFTNPATFVTSAGVATLALPTGFLGQTANRECYINETPPRNLEFAPESYIVANDDAAGEPIFYTFRGDSMRFGPTPDAAYGIVLGYYKKFDPLGTTATNWLLTNAPGVYLYAALLEAQPFIRNDARLPLWASMLGAGTRALMKSDEMDRWSGQLVARPDGSTP